MTLLDVFHVLLNDFLLSGALFFVLWIVGIVVRDPSFIDSWWGLGVAVLALATFLQAPEKTSHTEILAALAAVWGVRLGVYLFWRWRKYGFDRRYRKITDDAHEKLHWGFTHTTLVRIFLPQFFLQFVLALPVTLGQLTAPSSFGPIAAAGAALAGFGILYEMIADLQLSHFKSLPANAGQIMDKGLWRYSRHPNYFGELCVWWGIYLVACESIPGALTIVSPIMLTFLLTRVSGMPATEPHMAETRPGYADYKARTSPLIPWWPRRAKQTS
jgi:steroid 5-alpha reductase family enzyme